MNYKKILEEKPLLTGPETAKLLNVHPITLRRWTEKGFLNPVRISPHKCYYRSAEIIKLIGMED